MNTLNVKIFGYLVILAFLLGGVADCVPKDTQPAIVLLEKYLASDRKKGELSLAPLHRVYDLFDWITSRSYQGFEGLSEFTDSDSPLSLNNKTLPVGKDPKPIYFEKRTTISFEPAKTNLTKIQGSRFTSLRKPLPVLRFKLTFNTPEQDGSESIDIYVLYNTSLKKVIRVCLKKVDCLLSLTSNADKLYKNYPSPPLRPTETKISSSGFDQIVERYWEGELSPVTALVVNSGVDYNNPLIQPHLLKKDDKDSIPKTFPRELLQKALESDGFLSMTSDGTASAELRMALRPAHWGYNFTSATELPYDVNEKRKPIGGGTMSAGTVVHGSNYIKLAIGKAQWTLSSKKSRPQTEWYPILDRFIKEVQPRLAILQVGDYGRQDYKKDIQPLLRLFNENPNTMFVLVGSYPIKNGNRKHGRERNSILEKPFFPAGIPAHNTISVGVWNLKANKPEVSLERDALLTDIFVPSRHLMRPAVLCESNRKCFLERTEIFDATPWAANVIAKIWTIAPELSPVQVKQLLLAATRNTGLLDVRKALLLACNAQKVDAQGCMRAIRNAPLFVLGGPYPIEEVSVRTKMKACVSGELNPLCAQKGGGDYAIDFGENLADHLKGSRSPKRR